MPHGCRVRAPARSAACAETVSLVAAEPIRPPLWLCFASRAIEGTKRRVNARTLGDRLRTALGVTRVASLTELDRLGVFVCSAIRPGGHVLQVCNGKGLTPDDAELSALGETAELVSAE